MFVTPRFELVRQGLCLGLAGHDANQHPVAIVVLAPNFKCHALLFSGVVQGKRLNLSYQLRKVPHDAYPDP